MNRTIDKGAIAEAALIGAYGRAGYSVSVPVAAVCRYDLIIDDGQKLRRIQCKLGRLRSGCIIFNSCSVDLKSQKRKAYTADEIEAFGVWCPETETAYEVPVEIAGKTATQLRIDKAKKRDKRILPAENFIISPP